MLNRFMENYKPVLDNPITEVNRKTGLNFPLTSIMDKGVPTFYQPTIYGVKGNPLNRISNYAKERAERWYLGDTWKKPIDPTDANQMAPPPEYLTLDSNNFQKGGQLRRMQWAGPVSSQDSVRNMAGKILKYEQLRGGSGGAPLPQYSDPKYMQMLMQNIYPEVKKIIPNASAMETGEAMDFVFNAGWDTTTNKIAKDPRAFALQEYYRQSDASKLDADGKWAGRKNAPYSFDQEYNATIGKLPENQRRVLMNKGRDWYYKNINNPAPGIPNSNYNDTWYGRIWNTNDYAPFNASDPRFVPKKDKGGESPEYKGQSIVDYLATKGYSGKKAFRKDLASKYGVDNYDYSAAKNTELMNRMQENDDLLETYKQTMQPISVQRMMEMEKQQGIQRSAPQMANPALLDLMLQSRTNPQVGNNMPVIRGRMQGNQQVVPPISNKQELPMYQPPRWNTTPQPSPNQNIVPTPGIDPNIVWNTSGRNPRMIRQQESNPLPGIDPNMVWNRSGINPRIINPQINNTQTPNIDSNIVWNTSGVNPKNFSTQPTNLPVEHQDWGWDEVPDPASFSPFDRFPAYPKQPAKAPASQQVAAPDWRYVQPGKAVPQNPFQQFPAYPARQVGDLPKKTTAKAAAKNLEKDIEEESWFDKAGSAVEDGMDYASGLFNGFQRKIDSWQKEDPRSITKVNIPTTINKKLPGKTAGNKKDSASAIPYGYKQLYAVPDSKNPKDSLVSFVNLFDNDEGGRYYIGHKAKEVTDAGAQSSFDNAEGVAHFLRDSDILPGQKITPKSWDVSKGYTYHTTSPGKTVSAAGFDDPNRFRMLYKPNPNKDGSYLAKYVKNAEINPEREAQLKKEGWEQDFTVNAQHKFTDIAWDKDGPSTGYAAASKWLPLKNGKHTYIPYKSKDGFSRFSGGSGVYLFKDPKTGKKVGADASGSVNTIRKIGEDLIKTFGLKPEDLELAYHDMGSYSAKPKAHNGKLDYKQWLDYNRYSYGDPQKE